MTTRCASLDLGELARKPLRLELNPAPSLVALTADVAGAGRGAPESWIRRIRAELDQRDLVALRPLGTPPTASRPACVVPYPATERTLAEELGRIAELPAEVLLDDIGFACGADPKGPWAAVARQPRRWLPRYASAMQKAWRVVRHAWGQAGQVFEHEALRVEEARDRGASAELLAAIHPRARVAGGLWQLPDRQLSSLRLGDDGLLVIPILGGPRSAGAALAEDGTLEWIGYPPAGTWSSVAALGEPARLEALVGDQRARLLRALNRPRTVGRLAKTLVAVPSAATHQIGVLEAAGLVLRERQGRNVVVHRTARGTELVGLYDES